MVLYQLKLVDQSLKNKWHISSQMTTLQKEEIPNINIINGIHKIKGKTSVNILVSNYTNKHITFSKGEYVGHLEPALTNNTTMDHTKAHPTNSVTLQKMMARTS